MVQIFETEDPRGRIGEMLGMSLGKGLGKGISTFYANKALDDVLNDESMKDKPISARMVKFNLLLLHMMKLEKNFFKIV